MPLRGEPLWTPLGAEEREGDENDELLRGELLCDELLRTLLDEEREGDENDELLRTLLDDEEEREGEEKEELLRDELTCEELLWLPPPREPPPLRCAMAGVAQSITAARARVITFIVFMGLLLSCWFLVFSWCKDTN